MSVVTTRGVIIIVLHLSSHVQNMDCASSLKHTLHSEVKQWWKSKAEVRSEWQFHRTFMTGHYKAKLFNSTRHWVVSFRASFIQKNLYIWQRAAHVCHVLFTKMPSIENRYEWYNSTEWRRLEMTPIKEETSGQKSMGGNSAKWLSPMMHQQIFKRESLDCNECCIMRDSFSSVNE